MEPAGKVSQSLVQRLPSWVGLCKLCNQGCKQLCSMVSMHSICPVEWRLGLFASKQCSTHLPRGSGCPTGNGLCKAVERSRYSGEEMGHRVFIRDILISWLFYSQALTCFLFPPGLGM